ncbi:PREDICTED: vanin-like protein 2 [Nicrophorus vespilloides]|uniref:Vanin-like protein 2 n=1 Tax=Nicrophorus vespilloides TaxID=110193 RepID=A0ABM1MBM4_NICVS|nr:PREDICTED: vanin-like protein 2 [Nicrophorus vespilloides]
MIKIFMVIAAVLRFSAIAMRYDAILVEYSPVIRDDARITMHTNIQNYFSIAKNYANYDLIVFPEYGITSVRVNKGNHEAYAVEITQNFSRMGDDEDNYIRRLSEIASSRGFYLVANLLEKDNGKYYNTNVVFDRRGALIYKYRKINLNEEERTFLTAGETLGQFHISDFNTKFAMFIGEDILAGFPVLEAINLGITDIIHTNAMKSSMPFLAPLAIQEGFAHINKLNVLVSSYKEVTTSRGGYGFLLKADNNIASRTSLNSLEVTSQLMTPSSNVDESSFEARSKLSAFRSSFDLEKHSEFYSFKMTVSGRVCSKDNKICCTFTVHDKNVDDYAIVTYSDGNNYGCALVACDKGGQNCGRSTTENCADFSSIEITSEIANSSYIVPIAFDGNLKSFHNYEFKRESDGLTILNGKKVKNLSTFGIFGNGANGISSNRIQLSLSFLLIKIVLCTWI